jgi:alkylation response protein AidB-like acyl-CoA dehydrogenase
MVVFARNEDTKVIECFILHLDSPGVSRSPIPNKMPLRPVHNMQLYFQNVRIPANRKLPGVKGFPSVARLLAESRIGVAWVAAGIGLGVYDFMMKYLTQRKQFDKPLTHYQLIQDKIVKVMGRVQAALLITWQAQNMANNGNGSIGRLAFAKAIATKNIR